jgi:F0F1-type ATP synthase assembly protein I
MKKTTAPLQKTLSPAAQAKPHTPVGNQAGSSSPGSLFISAALDMSWRLAIVVLVPIIGGFKLDQHFNTAPKLTVVGFLLALGGIVLVLRQMLREVS